MKPFRANTCLAAACLVLAGCSHSQSVLAPGGPEAERWYLLTMVLAIGGIAILVMVVAFIAIAMRGPPRLREILASDRAVIGGGLIFPIVTLSALLIYGLFLTASGQARPGVAEPLRITVIGEQWWWRIIYEGTEGFETANELKIPAGKTARVTLKSADVIHSFWVPNLAGKLDMIPGRSTVLTLDADKPGKWRGQCAEYCGGAHALMAFQVEALAQEDFSRWLQEESSDATTPSGAQARRGQVLFNARGCGGCHTVRGTQANGSIGPDLTHFGDRTTLAASILPNTIADTTNWIRHNQTLKPQNLMLPYDSLPEAEARAIATYLSELK